MRWPMDDEIPTRANGIFTIPSPEILAARVKANRKHSASGNSMEDWDSTNSGWPVILGEEFGEVCRAYWEINASALVDSHSTDLRAELIDMMAIITSWIQSIDEANW